jgi:hypothetical protein
LKQNEKDRFKKYMKQKKREEEKMMGTYLLTELSPS